LLGWRRVESDPAPLLLRLRRFSGAEIGLGFTVILAAASLTAQSPSVDETPGRTPLTGHQVAERMEWRWPSFPHRPRFRNSRRRRRQRLLVREATSPAASVSDAN